MLKLDEEDLKNLHKKATALSVGESGTRVVNLYPIRVNLYPIHTEAKTSLKSV